MAWFALAADDRVDIVCNRDPAVDHPGEEAEMITCPTPPPAGATVYTIRPLTWVESQRFEAAEAAEQISGVIRLGLVAVDGDTDQGAKVAENPHPALAVPMYAAIMRLTWGAFFSEAPPAGRG
jgi:hypothetical protein